MAQPQPDRHRATKPRGRRGVPVQAEKIRQLRERTGVNVSAFAAKIGISRQHMYNLEGGWKKNTTPEVAHRIATELGVDYEQIVAAA